MERDHDEQGASAPSLWKRAPWWRAIAIGAAITTVGAVALFPHTPNTRTASSATVLPQQPAAPTADTVSTTQPSAQSQSSPGNSPSMPTAALDNGVAGQGAPGIVPVSSPHESADEEEQAEAMCHPHLLAGPPTPQVDVVGLPSPNLAHIKIHFWVNGAGRVTREQLTGASYGTPAEQAAELAFVKQLTFSLPNTQACRSREVELISDVFEGRNPAAQWETYARLYPRYSFTNAGVLMRRE